MKATPVTVVFDIGKTNKKVFLFDDQYQIVWEKSEIFEEISDDDGYPCDDIHRIASFVKNELTDHLKRNEFEIIGVNFTTYGASLVFINADGKPVAPIYNYLKPFPESLKRRFYDTYGGETYFSYVTASPVLGSLNSGLMLYRIMHEKRTIFNAAEYALHLPQYVSSLITGKRYSELTSIGCHTGLWNFETNTYHEWVVRE
jgi:sugar (pentulose or hexulose) kinase